MGAGGYRCHQSFIYGAPLLYAEGRCHDNMEPRYVLFQPEANPLCVMCTHEADYRRPERTIGTAPPRHIHSFEPRKAESRAPYRLYAVISFVCRILSNGDTVFQLFAQESRWHIGPCQYNRARLSPGAWSLQRSHWQAAALPESAMGASSTALIHYHMLMRFDLVQSSR